MELNELKAKVFDIMKEQGRLENEAKKLEQEKIKLLAEIAKMEKPNG
jgi:hypothetical protein